MLGLLRTNTSLRRLWLGEVISLMGDWLTYVAISLLALESGQGLMAVAFVLIAHTLPNALLSPVAGYFVDRFDRRTVLVAASVVRGVVTLAMAAAAAWGSLWLAQGFLLLRTAVSAFHEPALQAVLPRVVSKKDLLPANALLAATWSVMFGVGVALGGVLAAGLGAAAAIAVDAVTFFAAGAVLMSLPSILPEGSNDGSRPRSRFIADLVEAWSYMLRRGELFRIVLGKTPVGFATGGAWVLLNHVAEVRPWLFTTAATIGTMHALRAAGTGIGPVLWMRSLERRWPNLPLEVTTLVTLAGIALFIVAPHPAVLVLATVTWGMGSGANWVVTATRLQTAAPDGLRGRLSATDLLGMALGLCVGAWTSAAIGEFLRPEVGAWSTSAIALGLATTTYIVAKLQPGLPLANETPTSSG